LKNNLCNRINDVWKYFGIWNLLNNSDLDLITHLNFLLTWQATSHFGNRIEFWSKEQNALNWQNFDLKIRLPDDDDDDYFWQTRIWITLGKPPINCNFICLDFQERQCGANSTGKVSIIALLSFFQQQTLSLKVNRI